MLPLNCILSIKHARIVCVVLKKSSPPLQTWCQLWVKLANCKTFNNTDNWRCLLLHSCVRTWLMWQKCFIWIIVCNSCDQFHCLTNQWNFRLVVKACQSKHFTRLGKWTLYKWILLFVLLIETLKGTLCSKQSTLKYFKIDQTIYEGNWIKIYFEYRFLIGYKQNTLRTKINTQWTTFCFYLISKLIKL